jgi:hypothetical protein
VDEKDAYAGYETKSAGGAVHQQMMVTAAQAEAVAEEIERLEEQLANTKAMYRTLTEQVLPEQMEAAGFKEITTLSGTKIKVQELVTGSCPVPSTRDPELMKRRSRIFKWLDDNGYGKIISRELVVDFDRAQAEQALVLETKLREQAFQVHRQYNIHPQTFNKFVRELLADGKDLPEDFSVHRRNVAKIVKD